MSLRKSSPTTNHRILRYRSLFFSFFFFSFNSPFFRLDGILVRALIPPAAAYLAPIDSASYQAALIFGLPNIAISRIYMYVPRLCSESFSWQQYSRGGEARKRCRYRISGKYPRRFFLYLRENPLIVYLTNAILPSGLKGTKSCFA